ncbi:MAG: HAD-IC family P-type ATPase [Bacillota bacterium]
MHETIQEISLLPGRARLKYERLKKNRILAQLLSAYLDSLKGVTGSKININTTSIIINYNSRQINYPAIKERLIKLINLPSTSKRQILDDYNDYRCTSIEKDRSRNYLFLYLTIYLLLKIKQHRHGKNSYSKSLWVLLLNSSVVIAAGYPIFKTLTTKSIKNIPLDTDLLLQIMAILLTMVRESNEGVLVLALKSFNDYLKNSADLSGMKLLNQSMQVNKSSHDFNNYKVLNIGDTFSIDKGEYVELHGEVIAGEGLVNTLYCTGQPLISKVGKGSKIYEGSLVVSGHLKIKVLNQPRTNKKEQFPLAANLRIKENVTRFSNVSTSISLVLGVLNFILTGNLLNTFSIFLILCPVAAEVAIGTGLQQYISKLQKGHIYLKNIDLLEKIVDVDYIFFDKTGTLTSPEMDLEKVILYDNEYSTQEILEITASCEADYYHPISNTLKYQVIGKDQSSNVVSLLIPAKGIKADFKNLQVLIGNKELMLENHIDITEGLTDYCRYEKELYTPLYISVNKKLSGLIVLKEMLRKDAVNVINLLNKLGKKKIIILTGDEKVKAEKIAAFLGISKVYANCNYLDKAKIIEEYKKQGTVMMVGDGINDLLAMKKADISVSFADLAYDKLKLNSDCIILNESLMMVPHLIYLSQQTSTLMHQNISFAKYYNFGLGTITFFNSFSPFTAKTINTLNSLLVMLLNQRISHITIPQKVLE